MENFTPKNLKRKSTNALFESPSGPIRTIRRQSVVTSTPFKEATAKNFPLTNDDEAERQKSREVDNRSDNTSKQITKREVIPSSTLVEFMSNWIKLCSENKVNSKNVWKIHIIDYFHTLIQTPLENPLQLTSATLGACAKIYCLRVDDAYVQVFKLAGNLNRFDIVGDNEQEGVNIEDGGVAVENNDNEEENDLTKKKKKPRKKLKKKTVATNAATLEYTPDLIDLEDPLIVALHERGGDINGIDNLFEAFLSLNSDNIQYDINYDEEYFDSEISDIKKSVESNEMDLLKLPTDNLLISPDLINSLDICPEFSQFSFIGWSADNDNHELNRTNALQPNDINLVFDMDMDPEPISNESGVANDVNASDDYNSDDENVPENIIEEQPPVSLLNKKSLYIENIADMRPRSSVALNLEYSYNALRASDVWAGPAHWKLKSIVNKVSTRPNQLSGANKTLITTVPHKAKRRTKVIELDYTADTVNKTNKTSDKQIKLKISTITNWDKQRNILPIDLHLSPKDFLRLFDKPINISIEEEYQRPMSNLSTHENYDYNNMNDSAFCNPPDPEVFDDHNVDDLGDHINDGSTEMIVAATDEMETAIDPENCDTLTGGNLIEAPRHIPKLFIPYASRAKKVNMKRIKAEMWKIIEHSTDPQYENNENKNTTNIPENSKVTKFSYLYKKLPEMLPPDQATNLSPALTLFALLHLANEHTLILIGENDQSDVTIKKA